MKTLIAITVLTCGITVTALPKNEGAVVKDSTIVNVNEQARIEARNRSAVNTGIQARGAEIGDATLTNRFSGTVTARNRSAVTTGIKADDATIRNSTIAVDTRGHINADNATVKTGVDVREARNSTITTTFTGNINAAGATVKAGAVEGEVNRKKITTEVNQDINAVGKSVTIGTVSAGSGRGSGTATRQGLDFSRSGRSSGASVGNVQVQGGIVREVNTTVGGGNVVSGLKTRHMAHVYQENNGIDPTGTKNVYVTRKEKERALKTGGSVGNTNTADPRIRKVNTYVE
ncbi:MAG: hypothetical protein PHQ27_09200 [Victivallales bacterium]|nr:hypothetical protein [Victivallales bacterium]